MSEVDYESMSVAQLDKLSVQLKVAIEGIRDERRAAKAVRDRKVLLESLARRLGVPVEGITPEQAASLLELARQTPPRPGDVVVAPEPGLLSADTIAPEVQ